MANADGNACDAVDFKEISDKIFLWVREPDTVINDANRILSLK